MTDANKPRNEPADRHSYAGLLVLCVFVIALAAMLIPMCTRAKYHSSRAACQNYLAQMFKAMHVYAEEFGNRENFMPHTGDAFFTCLLGHTGPEHSTSYATKAPCYGRVDLFCCPYSGSDISSVTPGGSTVDYMGPARHPLVPSDNPSALVDGIPPHWPIACDKPGNHEGGKGNVLRFDGTVRLMEGDEYTEAVKKCAD